MNKYQIKLKSAQSLQKLLEGASSVSRSEFGDNKLLDIFCTRGFLQKKGSGKISVELIKQHKNLLIGDLKNTYGIECLEQYISDLQDEKPIYGTRAEAIQAGDFHLEKKVSTENGFVINAFHEFSYELNNETRRFIPKKGEYVYISDPDSFKLANTQTKIVLFENSEPFNYLENFKYLFNNGDFIFTKRWPNTMKLPFIKWINQNKYKYIHFGDFDLAGISIYLTQYLPNLNTHRLSEFFIPNNIEELINKYGTTDLFDKQYKYHNKHKIINDIPEEDFRLRTLIELIYKNKKCLRQEFLTKR